MNWKHAKALVTGGASFIGSALVNALVERRACVRVINNLSSGKRENLLAYLDSGDVEFLEGNLLKEGKAREAVRGMDVVFHLAADHGGCGYVDLRRTTDWYFSAKDRGKVGATLERLLTKRTSSAAAEKLHRMAMSAD